MNYYLLLLFFYFILDMTQLTSLRIDLKKTKYGVRTMDDVVGSIAHAAYKWSQGKIVVVENITNYLDVRVERLKVLHAVLVSHHNRIHSFCLFFPKSLVESVVEYTLHYHVGLFTCFP